MNDKLLERLQRFKREVGVPYKRVAMEAGIPYKSLTNYTSGYRDLAESHKKKVDKVLQSVGY